jgi:hypothetical protein
VPFQKTLEKLYDIPIVGDIRGAGFFWGIEMVKNRETRESFNSDESEQLLRGFLSKALFDNGLCVATQQILCSPCHDVVAGTAGLTTGETQSSSWRPPSFAPRSTSTRLRCTAPARHFLQSLRRRRSQHQQRVTPRVFPRNTCSQAILRRVLLEASRLFQGISRDKLKSSKTIKAKSKL